MAASPEASADQLASLCEVECWIRFKPKKTARQLENHQLETLRQVLLAAGAEPREGPPAVMLGRKVRLPEMQRVICQALAEAMELAEGD
jgi:hypothetical protein